MNLLKYATGAVLVAVLSACGGGGGSSGSVAGVAPPSTTTPIVIAASFVFSFDKTSITNGDTDKATLTVTALDALRNVVKDQPVVVSVDSGAYIPITSITDVNGQASGNITTGGDKSDRIIKVSMKVADQTASAEVAITGSKITLTPLPTTVNPGASVQVLIKATDANGAGVPGKTIQLGGTLGFNQSVTTGVSGAANATIPVAPSVAGVYTITGSGLGVTATGDVQVVSGTNSIPAATGTISSASLAASPNTIPPNVLGATSNRTSIRAVFQDGQNQAIKNIRVRFEIVPPGLGSGEQISTGNSIVYSNISGEAVSEYIAGTRSSPTNAVSIRACYAATDTAIAGGACPNSVIATLTVAGQPLSITLGSNNELAKGANNLTYIKLFDVAVADAAGNAVPNASLSVNVDIELYGKGRYSDVTADGSRYQGISTTITPSPTKGRVWCPNEDINRNGFLDTGEDIDGNGVLFPRKADVVVSFVGANKTGANGRATVQVEYPQNVATWLFYTIKVTTNVAGSEGTVSKGYVTSFVEGDDKNGSFLTPPFGVGSCVTPF